MKAITVVGIDPGLERVGYGVLVGGASAAPSATAYGCIETARGLTAAERIREVYDAVSAVLDEHRPDCVAIEQVFFTRNITSALAVSEVRGVILLAAGQRGIPVAEYTPNQIKQAVTGSGRAGKRQPSSARIRTSNSSSCASIRCSILQIHFTSRFVS